MNDRLAPLTQISDALTAAVETVAPSVVRVEARRRGNASGVAWAPDLVLATHHTIQRDQDIRVGLHGGETVAATLVGRDERTDLALLRVEGAALTVPEWADVDALAVGSVVLSVGRHDRNAQAAWGIVSQKDGAWKTYTGGEVDAFVQTTIGVYPGFSGSALVDARGRVAGLNTSWLLRMTPLALPLATLRRVATALAAHGRMRRGYLGVTTQAVRLPREAAEALGQETGLVVLGVEDGGPADAAGVRVGDLIVRLGDAPIHDADSLVAALAEAAGSARALGLWRGGRAETVDVGVGER